MVSAVFHYVVDGCGVGGSARLLARSSRGERRGGRRHRYRWQGGASRSAKTTVAASKHSPAGTTLTLIVDRTDDDGAASACTAAANDCSLRGAITNAGGSTADEIITFDPTVFGTPQTITLGGTEIVIAANGTLAINGPGADLLTISGGNASRIMSTGAGVLASISGIKFTEGNGVGAANTGRGGAIYNNFGTLTLSDLIITGNTAANGGGLNNAGSGSVLYIDNCVISNNTSTGSGGGMQNFSTSTAVISNSTFSDNQGESSVGGGGAQLNGTVQITNSTFANNSATAGSGGAFQSNGSSLVMTNVTVSGNTSATNGGGIHRGTTNVNFFIRNSIVAGNSGDAASPDITNSAGGITSEGNNIIGNVGTSTGWVMSDQLNTNPMLGTLAANGGFGQTFLPLTGSPAIDAGNNCVINLSCSTNNPPTAVTMDQRGTSRPQGATVDVGSVEVGLNATFPGTGVGPIPDNSPGTPLDVTFDVAGVTGPLTDVQVDMAFSVPHTWAGDVDVTLIAPGGASHVLYASTGATTPTAVGDSSDLTGPYNFTDAAAGTNWWAEALAQASTASLTAGDYRTTEAGPQPVNTTSPETNMTAAFAGVTNPNGTWTLRFTDNASGDTGAIGSANLKLTWNPSAPTVKSPYDFDGDGKTDLSIFRPSGATGSEWWYLRSSNGGNYATQFGSPTDKLVAADYTGDGKADIAFWRPSTGEWFILRSEDSTFYAFPFGSTGDVPAPADYDGDGKADAAVFRPSSSTWFIQNSGGGTTIQAFGSAGDVPVAGDYDGDGKADIAIFRPNGTTGSEWWILRSTAGLIAMQFGAPTDKTVVGDYTGDGKADVAFWRPSTGEWYILRSEDSSFYAFPFGSVGDIPVPGDYDGDGKADAAVFRPSSSTWFAQGSTSGTIIQQFGSTGDVPVPNEFVR